MCKHIKLPFLADYSFKICENPSKFSKSVRVVDDYADTQFKKKSNYICCYFFVRFLIFQK